MKRSLASLCLGCGLFLAGVPLAAASPYWVFFRDRGPQSESISLDDPSVALAIARALPAEAWAGRARASGSRTALPDDRDLPLWPSYVDAIGARGRLRHQSRWLNAVSCELDEREAEAVAALPFVLRVRPVAVATIASLGPEWDDRGNRLEAVLEPDQRLPGTPAFGREEPSRGSRARVAYGSLSYGASGGQLTEIGVPGLHALGYSGNGVRFMMLDTGFRKDHQALAPLARIAEWDFVFEDGNVQNEVVDHPTQQNHGTATWAIAGGYAPGVLIGPAYGASFWLAKTEDVRSETRAEEDNYVAALEWAESEGIVLTSASLSYLCFDDGFCYETEDKDGDTAVVTMALDIAAARGILCVNSQGNYGCAEPTTLGTPADADSIIAVGAVDSLNAIAGFSACGPTYDGRLKPEVVARGVRTWTASGNGVDLYGFGSGTSFSAPLVSGAAALLLEAHPEWGAMDVREALMATADRAAEPDSQYGTGRIDAYQAALSQPLLYPYPFSLVSPADSAVTGLFCPQFVWRASADPDWGAPLAYTLWLEGLESRVIWAVEAGNDTSVTLPFVLEDELQFRWWVTADDPEGHRRVSRERFALFFSLDPAAIGEAGADVQARPAGEHERAGHAGPLLTVCSPNPFRESITFTVQPSTIEKTPVLSRDEQSRQANESAAVSRNAWTVYDPLGRRVSEGTFVRAGDRWRGSWDGRARNGAPAEPGVYYLEARLGHQVARETILRLPE
ncbi:MAG: S8 family serine peptidase [Candidatus Eisenbacteria bacterium]|nr:S8 family serine peptidase [Candidatus Eisenbacteria bacterium]